VKAHFTGIGGIGMSSLARYFVSQGVEVTGSDEGDSPLIDELRLEGVPISLKHDPEIITPDLYQIVYSEAIPPENPELQRAQQLGIPQKSYFAALGDISRNKRTISICGTHGKSTTTAMAGLALENAFLDPLVILGTKVFEWESKNIRLPQAEEPVCAPKGGGLFLVESCEYHHSFLFLEPKIIVVTNVEPDHLDFFGTEEKYYSAFRSFAENWMKRVCLLLIFPIRRFAKSSLLALQSVLTRAIFCSTCHKWRFPENTTARMRRVFSPLHLRWALLYSR
jgi:UDP-N-acetylmuramate--alanine ligase